MLFLNASKLSVTLKDSTCRTPECVLKKVSRGVSVAELLSAEDRNSSGTRETT